eukprot:927717_1
MEDKKMLVAEVYDRVPSCCKVPGSGRVLPRWILMCTIVGNLFGILIVMGSTAMPYWLKLTTVDGDSFDIGLEGICRGRVKSDIQSGLHRALFADKHEKHRLLFLIGASLSFAATLVHATTLLHKPPKLRPSIAYAESDSKNVDPGMCCWGTTGIRRLRTLAGAGMIGGWGLGLTAWYMYAFKVSYFRIPKGGSLEFGAMFYTYGLGIGIIGLSGLQLM